MRVFKNYAGAWNQPSRNEPFQLWLKIVQSEFWYIILNIKAFNYFIPRYFRSRNRIFQFSETTIQKVPFISRHVAPHGGTRRTSSLLARSLTEIRPSENKIDILSPPNEYFSCLIAFKFRSEKKQKKNFFTPEYKCYRIIYGLSKG